MRRLHARVAVFFFVAILLLSALTTLAWSPAEDVAVPASSPEGGSGAEVQWVPSGSYPGFYAARDNANLDPATYHLVGGHQSFYWDDLEPTEGNYQWSLIDDFIASEVAKGKRAAFGILTFNGRANEGNASNPPYRVPAWVDAAGHRPILCGASFKIPRYWDPVYLQKYRNFIRALAQRYDTNPYVEFIQIGVGKFGESQPCDDSDDSCVTAAMTADGFSDWSGKWAETVNAITQIYKDYFRNKPILLPNAPTFKHECERRTFTDYAIQRGVGLFPAELYPIPAWVDLRTKSGWDGCGKLDRILAQVEANPNDQPWVPLGFEGYDYMVGGWEPAQRPPDPVQFFWAVAAALHRRADYITLERNLLFCNWCAGKPPYTAILATMGWAKQYLGKHVTDTPSVWVILRETGYCWDPGCATDLYPQKGNYSFWLEQDDSLPQGRTVATTYLARDETVRASDWSSFGASCTNSALEVGQSFLRGTGDSGLKEGWICRRTDQTSNNRYMWFKIDDRYRNAHPGGEATITVTYLDRGTDTWRLEYDSTSGQRVAGTVTKGNTGLWKQAVFNLTDAAFNNGLSGADFRIDCMADGNEYIHMVDVRMGGPVSTYTPTLSPTPGTPTLSPVPNTPTITPNVTPTPRTITIKPGRADGYDTHIAQPYPTTNYGSSSRLVVRSLGTMNYRALIRFDTSEIPSNSRVQSARLYLRLDYYDGGRPDLSPRVSVYKVKRDWAASEATWNAARSGEPWQVAGCDGSGDRDMSESAATVVSTVNTWYSWDITSLVADWVANPTGNKGMILISDAGRELRFYSADDPDTRYNPYLVVTYIEGGGPVTTLTPTPSGVVPTNTPSVEPSPTVTEKRPSQDTYLNYYDPTRNYEHQGLRVYGFGYKKALLNFDLSDIPVGARIASATLQLTAATVGECDQDQNPLVIGVYKVNKPWVANQATWNLASSGVPWDVVGCNGTPGDREAIAASVTTVSEVSGSGASQVKRYTWDVTSIVQAWVNNPGSQAGLVLLSADGFFRQKCFYDSVYSLTDRRPLLQIVWRPALPTSTPTPTPGTPTPTPTPSTGAIEGTVFEDLNLNGRRDAGEPGLSGATVELWQGDVRLGQQVTSGSGSYRFEGLAPGIYTVKEIDPPGYLSTTPNEISGVVVIAGLTTSGIDFADYNPRVVTPPKVYLPLIRK